MKPDPIAPIPRSEAFPASVYAIALLWLNAYVCRDLFWGSTAYMNSMHGFWIALARRAGASWFQATWWPYWDAGNPFECTYAPLVPGLAAALAALRGVPHAIAFQSVTGLFYVLGPLTLFLMAWRLTRAPGYSFLAALFYSLTSITQILTPDGDFAWTKIWDARRLFLMTTWDDTPHVAALSFLPLVILFLARSIETRRAGYYLAAAVSIALAALASAFGPVLVTLAAICLLYTLRREQWLGNAIRIVAIGACGWALAAPFLSPSLLMAIRESSAASDEEGWTAGSFTALALLILGGTVLWRLLPRWTADWRLRFFAVLAWLMTAIPLLQFALHRHFLPQPLRYKFEMELALSLALVFGLKSWIQSLSPGVRFAILLVFLSLAGEQLVSHRHFEKKITFPHDATDTVEYRASTWADRNLPGVRVFLPGSVAMWADAFAPVQQFAGGAFSSATNQVQQNANAAIVFGGGTAPEDARLSLTWLKAFGVGAIGISGKESKEYWRPFSHPEKFDGVLPVLWRQDGVTLYRVPVRESGLAHVVPERAIVRRSPRFPEDVAEVEKYVAALDDASLPLTRFQWEGRNRIRIRTQAAAGQALSVQVTYHAGWHAQSGGKPRVIARDGLGLMWLGAGCNSPSCEIVMDYDGGWELRLCRWLSYAAWTAVLLYLTIQTLTPLYRRHLARIAPAAQHPAIG